MIPNEIIDQILDKTDIIEVISAYAPLKKAGQNFRACCPFHEEKTPSFMVSPQKQIYHCFGCGEGGNAISFLMKHEKMDFIEAIRTLADKAGVSLPLSTRGEKEKDSLAGKMHEINNIACSFYQDNLTKTRGKKAYEYFVQRGITERTAKLFRLGYAEDSWQALMDHCKTKGITPDILQSAGLILQNAQTKNYYDRFRDRIMFPISNIRGKILGFGARAMDNSLPKYVNSPETHIYRKGTQLYGLNFSKDYVRKQNYAIIVEGYFDLILPYQNEIRNVVATLGTALTPDHIKSLRRFTKNAIIIYDSDKAGEMATLRSLDLLIAEDMNVRIALLPKGSDPDSFVRKEGRPGFAKVLQGSKDLFDYKLGVLGARFKKDDPRGKARIVDEMLPTLARIKNDVLKSAYLKRMSERLSIGEEPIRSELRKVKADFTRPEPVRLGGESKKYTVNLAELTLLSIILDDIGCIEHVEKELGFGSFKNESITCILKKVHELHKSGKKVTLSHLISCFDSSEPERIISKASSLSHAIQDKRKAMEDCFRHIKKFNLKEALNDIQFKIKDAETSADSTRINSLIAEYNKLIKTGIKD